MVLAIASGITILSMSSDNPVSANDCKEGHTVNGRILVILNYMIVGFMKILTTI
jgi:hypothetical protein